MKGFYDFSDTNEAKRIKDLNILKFVLMEKVAILTKLIAEEENQKNTEPLLNDYQKESEKESGLEGKLFSLK